MIITLQHYLVLSVILFAIGAIGVISRRNIFIILMSIELMLASAALAVLSFSRWNLLPDGKALVFFVMAVIAVEAAIGLAIIIVVHRRKKSVLTDDLGLLRG
ncbi:MAG: NADH-quinone oxidoreductase subunit NuoK [Deltaproteobacteria bacterium]|jgi:NADH-quinone oxidoreductase subunit K|nr:NADH-quinone oxidoreductase subunit NuoK [Deltaproteobacteria bacterium]